MRTYAQILIELLTVFCIMNVTVFMNCRHDEIITQRTYKTHNRNKALPA